MAPAHRPDTDEFNEAFEAAVALAKAMGEVAVERRASQVEMAEALAILAAMTLSHGPQAVREERYAAFVLRVWEYLTAEMFEEIH